MYFIFGPIESGFPEIMENWTMQFPITFEENYQTSAF